MKEFQLIDKYFKPLSKNTKASQNLDDDTAKISLKSNEELIISKDLAVEDVHFLLSDGGFKIAKKILYSNLSDLASAGAKPLYYMLGFSKNEKLDQKFYKNFAQGLRDVQKEFNISLIGGDTVKSDKLVFSVTIFGSVKKGKNLLRNQAKNGDLIFVSGFIGDAYLARKYPDKYKNDRHFFPIPRIELGQKLLKKKLSICATDISDGLLADLNNICKASNLSAEISLEEVPISKMTKEFLLKNSQENILNLISAGEDYELIFSSSAKNRNKILALARELKLNISCVGSFKKAEKKAQINLLDSNNNKVIVKKLGYEH
jgi:thiamine-monophosphate kinase